MCSNTIETQATSGGFTITEFTHLRLGSDLLQPNNLLTFQGFVGAMSNL